MAATSIPLLSITQRAADELSAGRFVTPAGAHTLGVARTDALSGDDVTIDVLGIVPAEAGAAVDAGDPVQTDGSGRAVPQTAGPIVGRARGTAVAAGDMIEILLIPN
jgi:hypothetical protein